MRSAYVYYRIAPNCEARATERVDALLRAMAAYCSAPPRRLARCDDTTTWMEVYEGIDDFEAFSTALEAAARTAGFADFTDGPRHLECFVASGTETS